MAAPERAFRRNDASRRREMTSVTSAVSVTRRAPSSVSGAEARALDEHVPGVASWSFRWSVRRRHRMYPDQPAPLRSPASTPRSGSEQGAVRSGTVRPGVPARFVAGTVPRLSLPSGPTSSPATIAESCRGRGLRSPLPHSPTEMTPHALHPAPCIRTGRRVFSSREMVASGSGPGRVDACRRGRAVHRSPCSA